MLLGEANELFGDFSQGVKLQGILAGPRLKKLIEALLGVDGRRPCHVIKVVALSIPREGWSHGRTIPRMEKEVGTRKVLRFGERSRRVAKVGRVVIKKSAAI